MRWRDSLPKIHPKYVPLHRLRSYRTMERTLEKYAKKMLWFSEEKIGDPYKQHWRKFEKKKGDCYAKRKQKRERELVNVNKPKSWAELRNKKGNVSGVHKTNGEGAVILEKPGQSVVDSYKEYHGKTTTTFFTPQFHGSKLYKFVMEAEEKIRKQTGWSTKILEQSGVPLVTLLTTSFPIIDGCPRSEKCSLCEGKGVKCARKGVVYKITCLSCETDIGTKVYVGERQGHGENIL